MDEPKAPGSGKPDMVWYTVEKTIFILEKGLLLIGARETPWTFSVELHDRVEIVRPNGTVTRSRVSDIYPSNERAGGDLLVEGLRPNEVPPGSKLRVLHSKRRREEG
ncbi:MAG: hypothetical protein HY291_19335 [Planctomycetes bacterium]|nr:hypothetical protein [Planctomycetota bacterium]